jgi:hypothetical protein
VHHLRRSTVPSPRGLSSMYLLVHTGFVIPHPQPMYAQRPADTAVPPPPPDPYANQDRRRVLVHPPGDGPARHPRQRRLLHVSVALSIATTGDVGPRSSGLHLVHLGLSRNLHLASLTRQYTSVCFLRSCSSVTRVINPPMCVCVVVAVSLARTSRRRVCAASWPIGPPAGSPASSSAAGK